MREALAVAARARLRTAPNPTVGALVVRGGRVIARGATRGLEAHAEAIALARAGSAARGATLYVTLEPCAHWGRTPPCVEAVIAARPRRVVIGLVDPDPRTRGASIRALARAGIDVSAGVLADACARHHEGFVSRVLRGRPFTSLKLAASLDGRIATASGESRWISSGASRALVQRLRARTDAIVVGSETLLADDPELAARRAGGVVHRPLRVVVDSRLRTPPQARILDVERPESAWILCARDAPARRRARLERAGARTIDVRRSGGHLDLGAAWRELGRLGVNECLVEGGGGLAAALLRAGLVDRMHFFLAPLLIGADGRAVLAGLGVGRLSEALRPKRFSARRVGPDLYCLAEW
ncbi:MAG: bifunctional diaminohydroxyphosphoribosylaminopyrimidine deaminase/5-amino-6-(5-phosphoribosylamino)uracil reductase RibD [Deltaproteobacteria bacterium]|nr:bifunctional diaminohydroxyphosphoribosylaminopyrimidine deaminase/5-amino-6-(5-phosphoribosylamino)uracil reductase RibD [Deltaproteobacteria bacterium]